MLNKDQIEALDKYYAEQKALKNKSYQMVL